MRSTGIIRRLDSLGRIVPPMEMRRTLGIEDRDELEFSLEGDAIVMRKYKPSCAFCGQTEELTEFKGRCVCRHCLHELSQNL